MRSTRSFWNRSPLLRTIRLVLILAMIGFLLYQRYAAPSARAVVPSAALPNPSLTPGDVLTTNLSKICASGYTQTVRDVPEPLKLEVYREYGITAHQPGEYEVDHLISLELGGSNSLRNLWPESYVTAPLNAHVKDAIENKLHELICSGQLAVNTAQQEIAQNWVAAYQKYIGPLPSR